MQLETQTRCVIEEHISDPDFPINGVWIWHDVQIAAFLDKYEGVRTRYSEFTTPSKVLATLMKKLDSVDLTEQRMERSKERSKSIDNLPSIDSINVSKKRPIIPVGDRLVEYIAYHRSPYEKDFTIRGRGASRLFLYRSGREAGRGV